MFKKAKRTAEKSKIEKFSIKTAKLNEKDLKKVVGGAKTYNSSHSNTGN